MAQIPGLPADVYFGGAENEPLPDWREEMPDTDDPIEADEEDDNSPLLRSLYGYSPEWFAEDDTTAQLAEADEPLIPSFGARLEALLKKKRPT